MGNRRFFSPRRTRNGTKKAFHPVKKGRKAFGIPWYHPDSRASGRSLTADNVALRRRRLLQKKVQRRCSQGNFILYSFGRLPADDRRSLCKEGIRLLSLLIAGNINNTYLYHSFLCLASVFCKIAGIAHFCAHCGGQRQAGGGFRDGYRKLNTPAADLTRA